MTVTQSMCVWGPVHLQRERSGPGSRGGPQGAFRSCSRSGEAFKRSCPSAGEGETVEKPPRPKGRGSARRRSGVTTGEGCGEFLCCKDSIPGYYVFFYKAYSDPMTEVNVSVKEEKKNRFYVFYFLNKSLCSLIFTCLIFFS